jgi:molybdenum cofactor cytidylyltransferase
MVMDERVGAVILAAGESRRFGSPKQLAVVDGVTLLEHAIATARGSGLQPVVAVVPVWLTRPAGLAEGWLRWVRNPYPERGMSESLRLGLADLPEDVGAAVIMLGDQPRVPAETIATLLGARGERPIVAAEAGGLLAPPVLIERSHFGLAGEITGDQGLRDVLRAAPQLVQVVSVTTHPIDVDTPADLGRIGHMFDSDR